MMTLGGRDKKKTTLGGRDKGNDLGWSRPVDPSTAMAREGTIKKAQAS